MTDFQLIKMLSNVPAPYDLDAVKVGISRWQTAIRNCRSNNQKFTDLIEKGEAVLREPGSRELLEAIFGNSVYLSECVIRDPAFFCNIVSNNPLDVTTKLTLDLVHECGSLANDTDLMRTLRAAKRQISLTIAIADICDIWDLDQVTSQLSAFADLALSIAVSHLLRVSAAQGIIPLNNTFEPEEGSGLIIIGMGKLGAFELNYSSDIDLIILYDNNKFPSRLSDTLQNKLVRLGQQLIKILSERTGDGYVFRTDLRLRPDPSATPIVLSVAAAETYYESLGQNWERAAMIKARPVAGDLKSGEKFLNQLTPFIWRKNLDFAAIQDIHSIIRQIQKQNLKEPLSAEGYNIKLGSGGIREIEFFAQTLQLIWGGREPTLRSSRTIETLQDLVAFRHCSKKTSNELIDAYKFLRRVEHRLQMINDQQTHTLPQKPEDFSRLATFLGYKSSKIFKAEVQNHLKLTHNHFSKLFADSRPLSVEGKGNLSFTGGEPDPATLKTISQMGFKNPISVDATVRRWHNGRYRALRTNRARQILTELLPNLIKIISHTPDPDRVLLGFDKFLHGLPAGIQLFAMIQTNPQLMTLLGEIISMAPRLADYLSINPAVIDSVLEPAFFENVPSAAKLRDELNEALIRTKYIEDVLNTTRRWAHDRQFQLGVQQLQMLISSIDAAATYTDIAEISLDCMSRPVIEDFRLQYGTVEGSEYAILALGKFGSREMHARSDLDLVFIYRAQYPVTTSTGERSLPTSQYFARLSQRQITALTALTPDGGLFEVDMQLRPSGNSGPIATSLVAFSNYHDKQAWSWEHMALTRARVVSSTCPALQSDLETELRRILTKPRDPDKLLREVADMRNRLAREKPADCLWSLKYVRGGIIDIEFVAQYLALRYAADTPEILCTNTFDLIERLTHWGYLEASKGHFLNEALTLFQSLLGILSLTQEGEITNIQVSEFSSALKSCLARAGNCANFELLDAEIRRLAESVFAIFKEIIEAPAWE